MLLHPVVKCGIHPNATNEQLHLQKKTQQLQAPSDFTFKHIRPSASHDPSTNNTNLSAKTNLQVGSHPSAEHNEVTTSQAEAALRLLVKVVDCNEEFMRSCENRRLLEILGLKAKKKQAIIDENFLIAHSLKSEIDNLFNAK